MSSIPIKLTIVGDEHIGKTCALITFTTNCFPGEYVPTVFENYNSNLFVADKQINLGLWDTRGSEDFDAIRPLGFPQTDVFLVCFSVISPRSFESVSTKWCAPPQEKKIKGYRPPGWQSILNFCPGTPFILVGTKIDLREDPKTITKLSDIRQKPISENEGSKLAKEIGALQYMEISALTQRGLKDVFDEAIKCVILNPKLATKHEKGKDKDEPLKFNPGTISIKLIKGSNLRAADDNGLADPWVAIGTYDDRGHFRSIKKIKSYKRDS